MDCHYVAEIRYQECVQAAQRRGGGAELATVGLRSLTIGRASFDGLRSWLKRASRSVRLSRGPTSS
jgi:hypothetical protein